MKRFSIFALFISILLVYGCSCDSEESQGGITRKDVIQLGEQKISNFIVILPDILEFSEKYHRTINSEEKAREDANKKFFDTLKKSRNMQRIAFEHGFKSIDELIVVYKNVVLGYMSIKIEFTDFAKDVSNLNIAIQSNENRIKSDFTEKRIDRKEYEKQMKELETDRIRLSNIILIKKYETEIDKISSQYNQ